MGAEHWKPPESPTDEKPHEDQVPPHQEPTGFQRFSPSPSEPARTVENDTVSSGTSPADGPPVTLQAGLTQVIVDIHSARKELPSGSGIQSYESGSREQKSGTRLPKGSMLDKKIG